MKSALFLLLVAAADCGFALNLPGLPRPFGPNFPFGPPHRAGPPRPFGPNLPFGPPHRAGPPHPFVPNLRFGPPHRAGPHHRFVPNLPHVPHGIVLPAITNLTDFILISNAVRSLAEIPLQFLNCTITAATKVLVCAANEFANFLCAETLSEKKQLDMEAFKNASRIFIEAMTDLGCVEPLANITEGIAELVEKVKVPVVESLKNNPAVVSVVKTSCPAEVALRIFSYLLGANNTTC